MYVGNLITALGCIDAGITCMIDNSHNSRSAAHSDSAVKALFDSGIRAVHASGAATFGDWDQQWPQDLARLQREFFSSEDQLVTLRLFSRGLTKADWQTADRLGLWLSIDGAGRDNSADILQQFKAEGLLNERRCINHGYGLSDAAWRLIRDAGMSVNACPRSDTQWALGPGTLGLQDALNHGIRPGLSVDNETSYSTDMFTEMRVAFHLQRWGAHQAAARKEADPPAPLKMRDLLEFATIRGAENAALQGKVGTLTPGKEADIVVDPRRRHQHDAVDQCGQHRRVLCPRRQCGYRCSLPGMRASGVASSLATIPIGSGRWCTRRATVCSPAVASRSTS